MSLMSSSITSCGTTTTTTIASITTPSTGRTRRRSSCCSPPSPSYSSSSCINNTTTVYRDNADLILPLTVLNHPYPHPQPHDQQIEQRNQQIRRVIATLCPQFQLQHPKNSSCDEEEMLRIRPLTGGLSNELFVVDMIPPRNKTDDDYYVDDDDDDTPLPSPVLLRIHPDPQRSGLVDRNAENRLCAWLSAQSSHCSHSRYLAIPTYFGRFENGRVEAFYAQHAPLSYPEMPMYGPQVARLLAQLHQLQPPAHVLQKRANTLKISRTKTRNTTSSSSSSELESESEPAHEQVWTLMHNWRDQAARSLCDCSSSSQQQNRKRVERLLEQVDQEMVWLDSVLHRPPQQDHPHPAAEVFGNEIVLTHMDAQPLNILRDLSQDDDACCNMNECTGNSHLPPVAPPLLKLIDFEYTGWNKRVTDLGNTWCEYMDMNPPPLREKMKKKFATRTGIQEEEDSENCNHHPSFGQLKQDVPWIDAFPSTELQHAFLRAYLDESGVRFDQEHEQNEEEYFLTHLGRLVLEHSLISHLLWTIWSCVQVHASAIDFDYLGYANNRMCTYRHFKSVLYPVNHSLDKTHYHPIQC